MPFLNWRYGPSTSRIFPSQEGILAFPRPPAAISPSVNRGLGALVAQHFGVGLVEVRKEPNPFTDSDAWLTVTTPPDYNDRHLTLGFRRELVTSADRVLLVDGWVATGGQASGARELVRRAGGSWLGMSVIVDALTDHRRELAVEGLVHERDLHRKP